MTEQKCCVCKQSKNLKEFYKDITYKSGHRLCCRQCQKGKDRTYYIRNSESILKQQRIYRQSTGHIKKKYHAQYKILHPEKAKMTAKKSTTAYAKKYPERRKAVDKLCKAIKRGHIKKRHCVVCNTLRRVEGHHSDYSKPLDIEWLCRPCHNLWHMILNRWERKQPGSTVMRLQLTQSGDR